MRCVLVVDSGGSKSEAALVRDDGTVLGWGVCRRPGLSGRSERACREAARDALGDGIGAIEELHVSCLGRNLPMNLFVAERPIAIQVHKVREFEGAMNLAGIDHGVVVLAGTGAFVHVQTEDGRMKRLDGHGPLLGDCGSGYHIGHLAMQAAMRAAWHPRRHTALEQMVFSAFSVTQRHEMIPLNFTKLEGSLVAALAHDVDRAARAGDAIAAGILKEAAGALAETLRDALDSLGALDEPFAMVGTGSVTKRSDIYWDHFCRLVATFAPNLRPNREPLPSASGMALAVLRRLPGIDEATVRANLFESTSDFLNKREAQLP